MIDNFTIPMSIESDSKGYFDRQCPNPNCEYVFKVNTNDWKDKFSDEAVYCPRCGHCDKSDKWFTHKQVEAIKERATPFVKNLIQKELGQMFSDMARRSQNNSFVKITYKPGSMCPTNNTPIFSMKEWELDIVCEKCEARYSVVGCAYFCPCCGHNSVEQIFFDSLNTTEKMIESADNIKETMSQQCGQDIAQAAYNTLVEKALGNIVSAFQNYALHFYKKLSNNESARANDFQIIEKGDELFKSTTGKSYGDYLTQREISELVILFQKRHVLEHNNGLVDEKYIQRSRDNSYKIGQRIIVRKSDVVRLIGLVRKLCDGIKTIPQSDNTDSGLGLDKPL